MAECVGTVGTARVRASPFTAATNIGTARGQPRLAGAEHASAPEARIRCRAAHPNLYWRQPGEQTMGDEPMRKGTWMRAYAGVAMALLLLATLAGCKRNESGQLPAVSGEAIQAQREQIEGFGLVRAWPDQTNEGLAIALEFSQPLVGTQDFDKLVTFAETIAEPSGWTLDEAGTVLRYPHVKPDQHYTLRISSELTAADGSKLPVALEQKVYTGELEPVVGFASQGSVLPAKESRGLPVVSVNVAEVDVEFLRVREGSLPKFFAEFQRGGRRGSW